MSSAIQLADLEDCPSFAVTSSALLAQSAHFSRHYVQVLKSEHFMQDIILRSIFHFSCVLWPTFTAMLYIM